MVLPGLIYKDRMPHTFDTKLLAGTSATGQDPAVVPALTPAQEEVVVEVFGKPPEDNLAKNVTVKDIMTLKPRGLLNDSVINGNLEMIMARA